MDKITKELVALEVIKTLKSRFDNFPSDASDNRNAPFHEAFLKAFRLEIEKYVTNVPIFISLASWMHGLNTTLGQIFFENIAHILCNGEKREFKNLKVSREQQNVISEIITNLKNKNAMPSVLEENQKIFECQGTPEQKIQNFTADVYYEDDEKIVAIELKTVKPNSGIFKSEKEKMLYAKAALKNIFPNKKVQYFIGFPFDPLSKEPTSSNKLRFFDYGIDFKKFFDFEEVLLADQLWDFLSQEKGTMESLLAIINQIAEPDFLQKFDFINDPKNIDVDIDKYKSIISLWFLYKELDIIERFYSVNKSTNKRIKRMLAQNLFDTQNNYKLNRVNILLSNDCEL
ncbi:MAG: TdeIII family type II restriction endonuclease [Ignavibacteriaceae bacterium]|nr:TdeIII family type II restriction endonuclease [Ignavibacteriaceae bacterium]